MKTLKLLPNHFKKLGWIIFFPMLILGALIIVFGRNFEFREVNFPVIYNSGFLSDPSFFTLIKIDWVSNLVGVLLIIGGILVGFSKEKYEDEFISSLRLRSIFWSMLVSYLIFLLLFVSVFGISFFNIMVIIMYLPLILYIFRFNYLLKKHEK